MAGWGFSRITPEIRRLIVGWATTEELRRLLRGYLDLELPVMESESVAFPAD